MATRLVWDQEIGGSIPSSLTTGETAMRMTKKKLEKLESLLSDLMADFLGDYVLDDEFLECAAVDPHWEGKRGFHRGQLGAELHRFEWMLDTRAEHLQEMKDAVSKILSQMIWSKMALDEEEFERQEKENDRQD